MLVCCPECGSQVSDRAKCCPHCGYSFEDARNERAAEEAAIIARENQAAYDATFRPNELYLCAPMPLKLFCRPFTSRGRATRAEYWSGFGVFVLGVIMLFSVAVNTGFQAPLFIWTGLGVVILFNATSRRLHDSGASDALSIILLISILIPIFGWGFLILCGGCALFAPSVEGSNEHGPNPEVFYDEDVDTPVLQPTGQKRFVWKQKPCSLQTKQRSLLAFDCPHCGERCETEEEVQVGQHVICPYCNEKFSYSGEVGEDGPDCPVQKSKGVPLWANYLIWGGFACTVLALLLVKVGLKSAGFGLTMLGGFSAIVGAVVISWSKRHSSV